ncbi:helix-turn-helix transcriptional regulator [Catellatospora sp. NPDC049111]|uniref:helix-turn-helix domain-containing protein n=1 Tax=Catellatospora sp. NPDC049111 TaxID=3155271 RepID=UPI003402DC1B
MDEAVDVRQETLAGQLGWLLQDRRQRRGWSQHQLAERAAISQQQISRFERGALGVTAGLADRLFAELGLRLRVDVEAAEGPLDEMIDRVRAELAERQRMVLADFRLLTVLSKPGFAYVIDGTAAALLQGVPVAARRIDLLVAEAELDLLAEWVYVVPGLRRRNERHRDFSRYDIDPRDAGPLWWGTALVELKVRLVAELPRPVLVTVAEADGDEHRVAVRALPAVEADFAEVARVLSRLRAR